MVGIGLADNRILRSSLIGFWLFGLCAMVVELSKRTEFARKSRQSLMELPPLVNVDPALVRIVTLGHKGLYDDLLHIWVLQILADKRLYSESSDTVFTYINQVIKQSPEIETLYMLSCFIMLDFRRPELCEAISAVGIKAIPYGWRIPLTQGYVSALRLKDTEKGAYYYSMAASQAGSPAFLKSYADKLSRKIQLEDSDVKQTLDEILQFNGGSNLLKFLERKR